MAKSKSTIEKARLLIQNGYQVVPIANTREVNGKIKKGGAPLIKGHLDPEIEYTQFDVDDWVRKFPDASLALIAGKNRVYALDFDIDHRPLAEKFRKMIRKRFPGIALRACNPPRFAVMFRASRDLMQITNAYSTQLKTPDGELNQIELIGNRTITMYGEHRSTQKSYRWASRYAPTSTPAEDLPELTVKDIKKIFNLYDKHCPPGWKKVGESTFRKPKQATTFENVTITRRYSDQEVHDLLAETDGESYRDWVEVGMALHARYDGSKKGLKIWNEWSKQFDSYDGVESLKRKWPTFVSDGGITIATINRKVNRLKKSEIEGLEDEELIQFALDHWVLVEKPNEIADLSRTVGESMMSLVSMKSSTINRFVTVMEERGTSGEQLPVRKQLFDVWHKHRDRRTVHDYRYAPLAERVLQSYQVDRTSGLEYYNTYKNPQFDIVDETNLLKYFTDHMRYLFGENYDMAVNWFAQIIQEPGQRHRVALHSISIHQGTGRGWVVKLFNELCGDNVTTVPSLADMTRPGAKNGYLHESVLVTVNEMVCSGPDKYEQMNKVKTMLSDDFQSIDIKYGSQSYKTKVYTRMFCQANGITDLPIDEDDTRFMICLNKKRGRSDKYYQHLYSLVEGEQSDAFLNQVYTYLMRWKINRSWLQEAHKTKDKVEVIRACKSPTGMGFYDFETLMGDGIFYRRDLDKFMKYVMSNGVGGSDFDVVGNRELLYLVKQRLAVNDMITVNGKRLAVCSFSSHNLKKLNSQQIKKKASISHRKVLKYIKNLN